MSSEIPEGLAIEQVWAVEAAYAADAAARRPAFRIEHLTRMGALRGAGVVVEAGGYADMSGSLILVRTPTEDEALATMREDVYWREGIWVDLRIRGFGRVARQDELR